MIVVEWLFLTIAPCDAAEPWQLGSQDAATPMMLGIMDLHHDIFFFLILILVFVSWMLVRALWHFHYQTNPIPQRIVHGTTIEILRTIFPSIILMFIAIPSFALLYSMDEVVVVAVDLAITIKAIGHQWYWTYEYSDYNSSDEQSLTFDSYTIPEDDLELGQSRLLEVDNRMIVPVKTNTRIIVTPADVPHSWAVPSSGVKCDAVPGRSNQISISVQREGVYYGQCSEIRGTNHAFMPIVVETVPRKDYVSRVSTHVIDFLYRKVSILPIFWYPWEIVPPLILSAIGGDVIIYQAPSPGGPVEIFEIPPTPPQDQAVEIVEVPPTPPQDQAVEIVEVPPTPPQDQAVEASLNQGPDWKPNRNLSLESSLQGRIRTLEREHSMFLLDKENGEYWRDIKADLEGIKSPMEYAIFLDCESRDLSIRELRHACVQILEEELNLRGSSAAYIDYYPFFEEKRLDLESALSGEDTISPEIADHAEIQFLQNALKELRKSRSKASFFQNFLEDFFGGEN